MCRALGVLCLGVAGALAVPVVAKAAPAEAGAEGSAEIDSGTGGRARLRTRRREPLSKRKDRRWLNRWAPENGMLEFGPYVGLLFLARDVELFEPSLELPRQGFRPLNVVAPELGARLGYFPLRFFGVEVEGGYAPTATDTDQRVHGWMLRGHVIGQLGLWSVTPFVLVGGGAIAVASDRTAVGSDADQSFHIGLGTKIYFHRYVSARVDFRDVISPRRGVESGATNNLELLFGLSITLGRDRDKDKKPKPDAEPPPARSDRDGDGFYDDEDACPDKAGIEPDGCPPAGDRDGDGFLDNEDVCPDEKGGAPDGCPDLDADGDGILIPDDDCPDEPETKNGFEDEDGCPDGLPEDIEQFSGTIQGVFFQVNKATLRLSSRNKLDQAVKLMEKYPKLRVEISGHTDSTGERDHNMGLSQQRADAVKKYLTDHGVDDSRIETRGAGPDEPLDTNASKEGRSKNRRIEFRVLD